MSCVATARIAERSPAVRSPCIAHWPVEAFELSGEISSYDGRGFCPRCGSRLVDTTGIDSGGTLVEIRIGSLDEAPFELKPEHEIWVEAARELDPAGARARSSTTRASSRRPRRRDVSGRETKRTADREGPADLSYRGGAADQHVHLVRLSAEVERRSRAGPREASKTRRRTDLSAVSGQRPGFVRLPPLQPRSRPRLRAPGRDTQRSGSPSASPPPGRCPTDHASVRGSG